VSGRLMNHRQTDDATSVGGLECCYIPGYHSLPTVIAVTSRRMTSSDVTSRHDTWRQRDVTSWHSDIMSRDVTSHSVTSRDMTSRHETSRNVTTCQVKSRHTTSRHVMWRRVTSSDVTSCDVKWRDVKWCDVTSVTWRMYVQSSRNVMSHDGTSSPHLAWRHVRYVMLRHHTLCNVMSRDVTSHYVTSRCMTL